MNEIRIDSEDKEILQRFMEVSGDFLEHVLRKLPGNDGDSIRIAVASEIGAVILSVTTGPNVAVEVDYQSYRTGDRVNICKILAGDEWPKAH